MKIERLWDAILCGRIPPEMENKHLGEVRLSRRRYARILQQYEERKVEIAREVTSHAAR